MTRKLKDPRKALKEATEMAMGDGLVREPKTSEEYLALCLACKRVGKKPSDLTPRQRREAIQGYLPRWKGGKPVHARVWQVRCLRFCAREGCAWEEDRMYMPAFTRRKFSERKDAYERLAQELYEDGWKECRKGGKVWVCTWRQSLFPSGEKRHTLHMKEFWWVEKVGTKGGRVREGILQDLGAENLKSLW